MPKGIASKSPKLLVIVRPGYFLPLNHTLSGPTLSQSILSITPPCLSIRILSSFIQGVWLTIRIYFNLFYIMLNTPYSFLKGGF